MTHHAAYGLALLVGFCNDPSPPPGPEVNIQVTGSGTIDLKAGYQSAGTHESDSEDCRDQTTCNFALPGSDPGTPYDITLGFTPDFGWIFDSIHTTCSSSYDTNELASKNIDCSVVFAQVIPYQVQINVEGNGSVDLAASYVAQGQMMTFEHTCAGAGPCNVVLPFADLGTDVSVTLVNHPGPGMTLDVHDTSCDGAFVLNALRTNLECTVAFRQNLFVADAGHFADAVHFSDAPGPIRIDLTKDGVGHGTVTSTPSGIDCGPACTSETGGFFEATTLHAVPDASSIFAGWSGDPDCQASDTDPTTTKPLSAYQTYHCTATFRPPMLFVSVTGNGHVASMPAGIDCPLDCQAPFDKSVQVVLTEAPVMGNQFVSATGACSFTDGKATVSVMDGDARCDVTFEPLPVTHSITVTKGGAGTGLVTSSPSGIACGPICTAAFTVNTVMLRAEAVVGSAFVKWTGDCSGTSANVSLDITSQDKTCHAEFEPLYWLTVTKAGNGSGRITSSPAGIDCGSVCSYQFLAGTQVTLTADPDPGSQTGGGWGGACATYDTTDTASVTMTANESCSLSFVTTGCGLGITVTQVGSRLDLAATNPPSSATFYWSLSWLHGSISTTTSTTSTDAPDPGTYTASVTAVNLSGECSASTMFTVPPQP
jgi:hypothetical protein